MSSKPEFHSWRDIRNWADANGFKNIVKRMDINNDCWESCGEFGRSQVYICDTLRGCEDLDELMAVAEDVDKDLGGDEVVKLTNKE